MKYLTLFLLFFSNAVYSGWFETQCHYTGYRDVPVATRIPDNKLNTSNREQVWIPAKIKEGQCLYHQSSGKCNVSGVGNGVIFNKEGHTYSTWSEITNSPFYAEYCRNCYDENEGTPHRSSTNAYHNIWGGYKYKNCYDSQGVYGSNTDGCYQVSMVKEEYTYTEPCMQYICYETDQGDIHGLYPCQVECPDFNNKAQWDFGDQAYRCKPSPEIPPEEEIDCTKKEGVFDCFSDDVINKLDQNNENQLSIFQNLYDGVVELFNHLSFNNSDDDDNDISSPEYDDPDLTQLESDLPVNHSNLSINNFSLFQSNAECPANSSINLLATQISFSYEKLCAALSLMSNLVLLLGFFFGYKILRGA